MPEKMTDQTLAKILHRVERQPSVRTNSRVRPLVLLPKSFGNFAQPGNEAFAERRGTFRLNKRAV